jgi:hypothetical protein
MDTLKIVTGFVLLLAGSQLYWFVVATAGMIIGDALHTHSYRFLLTPASFTYSIKYSLLGVVFSITVKPFAVLSSGFILGGFLSYHLLEIFGSGMEWYSWPYFILGGAIAVALLLLAFAFSFILITALSGAELIIQSTHITALNQNFLLLLFLVLGLTSQYLLMNYSEPTLD